MQTIQMQLADDLITEIDKVVKENNINRSTFINDALQKALEYYHERKLIEKHRQGYLRHPIQKNEFSVWEDEQAWGNE